MECKVTWMGNDGMSFVAQTGSGHLVAMDGAPEGGGHNLAPRPMEMVLLGTGEPVDLIHVQEDDQGRRYFVERPGGSQILIREEQLGCRGFRLN